MPPEITLKPNGIYNLFKRKLYCVLAGAHTYTYIYIRTCTYTYIYICGSVNLADIRGCLRWVGADVRTVYIRKFTVYTYIHVCTHNIRIYVLCGSVIVADIHISNDVVLSLPVYACTQYKFVACKPVMFSTLIENKMIYYKFAFLVLFIIQSEGSKSWR